ncbi:MAG: hypothetical protein ACRDF4_02255 [Rhabdochlamydiaceae bacterium]
MKSFETLPRSLIEGSNRNPVPAVGNPERRAGGLCWYQYRCVLKLVETLEVQLDKDILRRMKFGEEEYRRDQFKIARTSADIDKGSIISLTYEAVFLDIFSKAIQKKQTALISSRIRQRAKGAL